MSRELHRVFRSQGFNIADEDRGAKIKSQSFLPPTELFELRQHQRLHGTALSGTRPDDTPLHGLVASTGKSPIIESAFHQPLMPHQMGRKPPAKLPNFRPKPPKMPRVTSTHSYGVLPPPTPRERRPRLGKVSPTSTVGEQASAISPESSQATMSSQGSVQKDVSYGKCWACPPRPASPLTHARNRGTILDPLR